MSDQPDLYPALDQLADDDDELDGCEIDYAEHAADDLEVLEAILIGDSEPGSPEAVAKLAYFEALAAANGGEDAARDVDR